MTKKNGYIKKEWMIGSNTMKRKQMLNKNGITKNILQKTAEESLGKKKVTHKR